MSSKPEAAGGASNRPRMPSKHGRNHPRLTTKALGRRWRHHRWSYQKADQAGRSSCPTQLQEHVDLAAGGGLITKAQHRVLGKGQIGEKAPT